jgi:hypothetical protein
VLMMHSGANAVLKMEWDHFRLHKPQYE